jgi:hypothetical protein
MVYGIATQRYRVVLGREGIFVLRRCCRSRLFVESRLAGDPGVSQTTNKLNDTSCSRDENAFCYLINLKRRNFLAFHQIGYSSSKYVIASCLLETKDSTGEDRHRLLINRTETRLLLFGKRSATSSRAAARRTSKGLGVYRNTLAYTLGQKEVWA